MTVRSRLTQLAAVPSAGTGPEPCWSLAARTIPTPSPFPYRAIAGKSLHLPSVRFGTTGHSQRKQVVKDRDTRARWEEPESLDEKGEQWLGLNPRQRTC
jgi:hypothetical protein